MQKTKNQVPVQASVSAKPQCGYHVMTWCTQTLDFPFDASPIPFCFTPSLPPSSLLSSLISLHRPSNPSSFSLPLSLHRYKLSLLLGWQSHESYGRQGEHGTPAVRASVLCPVQLLQHRSCCMSHLN